jgi:hypothetical protein
MTQAAQVGAPPITERMRASALANPNSWLYVLDPAFTDDDDVPQWAVVGAYPVDAVGRIEDRFAPNDTYRPSPRALGWPEPVTQLERIIQLAKAGHRATADLPSTVLDATLLVYDPGDGTWDGTQLIVLPDAQSGRLVVPACTSPEHVPADWPNWKAMRGNEMVPLLRGYPLAVNPDGPVSAILPAELLADAARSGYDPRHAEPDDTDDTTGEDDEDLRGRHRAS